MLLVITLGLLFTPPQKKKKIKQFCNLFWFARPVHVFRNIVAKTHKSTTTYSWQACITADNSVQFCCDPNNHLKLKSIPGFTLWHQITQPSRMMSLNCKDASACSNFNFYYPEQKKKTNMLLMHKIRILDIEESGCLIFFLFCFCPG